MARILVKEYCLELAAACSCAGSVCVFVMPSASWSTRVQHISGRSRNRTLKYAARMTRRSYFRMMSGATSWWTKLTHSGWLIHNESIPQSRCRGGGGVIGVSTAQPLARAGDVILLTESVLTSGASGRSLRWSNSAGMWREPYHRQVGLRQLR
jgi:hypothetical protein